MADEKGRSRRDWLRSFSGAGFFGSVAESIGPRKRNPSQTPPSEKPVIPAGSEMRVVGLLGPLARGPQADGYQLSDAFVGNERIDYFFDGAPGRVRVTLLAHGTTEGTARAYTRSFRVVADGEAPAATIADLADRVATEVMERDDGTLWVKALTAPRSDGSR